MNASATDFHVEMESLFRRTGEATGYWPTRFLQAVRRRGGLAEAKRLLQPGASPSGFGKVVEARRLDLSIEEIALSKRFSHLFSEEELAVARQRLAEAPADAYPELDRSSSRIPEEVDQDAIGEHAEGAVRRVLVNSYERDPKARAACISYQGTRCAVCDFSFEARYGAIGEGYVHVHHKRPLSTLKASYSPDPQKDLVPVCANCHAMLHRRRPPFDVEQLKQLLRDPNSTSNEPSAR